MADKRMNIPLLVPDMPSAEELLPYLKQIDENRRYTNFGPLVREYENKLSTWLGERSGRDVHAVTVNSGTAALELGLSALNLQPGARVLLPGITFVASATAITRMGFEPVFTDIDEQSWLLTPEIARGVIKHIDIDAVMPVATFGVPHDAGEWDAFTADTGIPVLIDAAAALSSQNVGETTLCAYSLHATKPLGVGEGGVVAASDYKFFESIRTLSNFGLEKTGLANHRLGTNAKLSEYHAAVGLVQLARRAVLKEQHQYLVQLYRQQLEKPSINITTQLGWGEHLSFPLPVLTNQPASDIERHLSASGIASRAWYCPSLVHHPVFTSAKRLNINGQAELEVSQRLGCHLVGLPFHTRISAKEIQQVVNTLEEGLAV